MVAERARHDPWVVEWARSLDDAADAWRSELEHLIDRLGLAGGTSVLDAGCGSGRITGWLAERIGPRGLVCALDNEPAALAIADEALRGIADRRIEGWHGDVRHLPFDDDTFDAAWSSRVLGWPGWSIQRRGAGSGETATSADGCSIRTAATVSWTARTSTSSRRRRPCSSRSRGWTAGSPTGARWLPAGPGGRSR